MRLFLALCLALWAPSGAFAQDCVQVDDCDGDGATSTEDCDDDNEEVFPGAEEICENGRDDDCDGGVDNCRDDVLQSGQLQGGSSCEGNGAGWAVLCVPLLGFRRRRS